MVSSLEVPVRCGGANLSLPETGSDKVVKLSFPLEYTGSVPSKVLAFAAAAAGEAVQLELSWPDRAAGSYKVVVKLKGAALVLPQGEGEKTPAVKLSFMLVREDTREPRELLELLLEATKDEVLELDLVARVVQPPLPFQKDGEGFGDADDLEERKVRRRPKGSSPAPAT